MQLRTKIALLAILPTAALSGPAPRFRYAPFEAIEGPPSPWTALPDKPVPRDSEILLHMPLTHADLATYEYRTISSHDPNSPNFQHTMSESEVLSYLSPLPSTVSAVYDWLAAFGIPKSATTLKVDWLSFNVTVKAAEELLQTRYAWYVNRFAGNQVTLRALGYSLPVELHEMVRFVQPTTLFATRWEKG